MKYFLKKNMPFHKNYESVAFYEIYFSGLSFNARIKYIKETFVTK